MIWHAVTVTPHPAPGPTGPRPGRIAVAPDNWRVDRLADAVRAGGGTVVAPGDATALVWADPGRPELLPATVLDHHEWVQLPFAGIEPFLPLLDRHRLWTCGKGVYARPVAEHVLTSTLSLLRGFVHYARQTSWSAPVGRNLDGSRVTVLGGGGITSELVRLLEPFDCPVSVLRRSPEPFPGAARTLTSDRIDHVLPTTDVLVLALALTPDTEGIIDGRRLALLPEHAVLVNVARGRHVVTDDLADALAAESIAGAVLDVTEPEPLPDGHRLWSEPRCLITPHIGNTPEMGVDLLCRRVEENTRRYIEGLELLGPVDVDLGY